MKKSNKRFERLGEKRLNNQGCLMKIIEYNRNDDIIAEFQDKYKARVHTSYKHFLSGVVKNPYFPSVCDIGMIGNKYPISLNRKHTKEYITWKNLLIRCFDNRYKNKHYTYEKAMCCDEWLLFENFYEWLHNQENFEKWYNGNNWNIDKDILNKGNKIYSPETCCLVPNNVNVLFTKRDTLRGEYPIGVTYKIRDNIFEAQCNLNGEERYLGRRETPEQAFLLYKKYKESYIKKVAKEEYGKDNITKQCYDAMMEYQVEITD